MIETDDESVYVDTDRLEGFIKKFGINYIDDENHHLLHFIFFCGPKQIDIIMRNRPNYSFCSSTFLHQTLFRHYVRKTLYIISKMIQYDEHFSLITCFFKTNFIYAFQDPLGKGLGQKRMVDYYKHCLESNNNNNINDVLLENLIIMLENHEKKYYTLFDLLKHHLN